MIFTFTDRFGNTDQCVTSVTVTDGTAPTISCPDGVTVNAAPNTCTASVSLSATAADQCSPPQPAPAVAGNGPTTYGLGSTTHTFTATDASGNHASCDRVVTVRDVTPPVVTPRTGLSLWPANHQYRAVSAGECVAVTDACNGQTASPVTSDDVKIYKVTSDEVEDAADPKGGGDNGDGNTLADMVIVDNGHVNLRAERQGTSNGRIYTIFVKVKDAAGNETLSSCNVQVPHDQGQGAIAVQGPGPGDSVTRP